MRQRKTAVALSHGDTVRTAKLEATAAGPLQGRGCWGDAGPRKGNSVLAFGGQE